MLSCSYRIFDTGEHPATAGTAAVYSEYAPSYATASAGQLSFVEAEEALKMSPGRDVHLKLSVKKTIVLLKIQYCKTVESLCS